MSKPFCEIRVDGDMERNIGTRISVQNKEKSLRKVANNIWLGWFFFLNHFYLLLCLCPSTQSSLFFLFWFASHKMIWSLIGTNVLVDSFETNTFFFSSSALLRVQCCTKQSQMKNTLERKQKASFIKMSFKKVS